MTTPEANPADVTEQEAVVAPGQERLPVAPPLEADDLDAAEQAVVVPEDEDEHR